MNNLVNESLAQIVRNNYRTAKVLEKFHLDFCCKGKRSLQQACDENKVAMNEVVTELEAVLSAGAPVIDFDKYTPSALIDYIVETHHTYVRNEMPQLYEWLKRVASKHGGRHPEMLKVFDCFAAIKEELELHMQKEELILFPRIKELERLENEGITDTSINSSYFTAPIKMMEQEHDHAGALMEEIRAVTGNYALPADACTTYRISFASLQGFEADLHQHVHLENNVLFPKTVAMTERLNSYGSSCSCALPH